ncbi:MAG TPA: TIR domain-containing protein [Caulobacteraceae bacterium]|nr:TIR domain-containing protein [Caulobacteraceae bacterium]
MSHVFISYTRSTAKEAQVVAAALRGLGHAVWLDDEIPAHRAYADVIEERLREARAVVVIWSAEAVKSEWVRSEADRARGDHKLVQLKVDATALPMPFDQIQCADLAGWTGDAEAPGWRKVAASVAELTGGRDDASVSAAEAAPARVSRPTICVLPFANMSGEPEQEYFSDGISEDIITALSKLRWFFVIARNSSFIYKGKAVHMKQIAEELGVGYVVEGSVRRGGDRVRITAQLNDVATGSHIWAEHYDRSLADVFAVQDEITEAIVAAIEPQLYAAENFRAQRKLPHSMDAWELVMRALSHYWRVTRQDNIVAQTLLSKAIDIDPNYGQALGLLAASYTFSIHMGWMEVATGRLIAERAAQTAIMADSEDPWAHYALAGVYLFARRFDDTLAECELALRLNPNFSPAQGFYGLALCYCGRWEEGDVAARRALRLSPRDPLSATYCGIAAYAQFLGRHYDEAIRLAREGIRQRSDFVGAHRVLTAAAGMAGQDDLAGAALRELRRAQPNISLAWIVENMPIQQDADREHYLEGLRRAGLD